MKQEKHRVRNIAKSPKYGATIHYWPEEMIPFVSAAACTIVVLDNSEKANDVFNEAVEAWEGDPLPHNTGVGISISLPFGGCSISLRENHPNRRLEHSERMLRRVDQSWNSNSVALQELLLLLNQ